MKSIKYIGLAALGVMSLVSCNDFLDAENKSSGNNDADKYFQSNPDAMVPYVYDQLRTFGVNINMHEHGSDLYYSPKSDNDNDYARFIINAEDSGCKSYYQNGQAAVQKANALIEYGGNDTKIGHEGRFVRAYIYFLLTQQFGGFPYITHYIQDANRYYDKTPLAEVYQNLISDMEQVYEAGLLPEKSHEGRASKQAVAGLLARLYLAAAWDIDTDLVDAAKGDYNVKSVERFKKAAAWSEKAIDGIKLTMSFEDKWSGRNEGNEEEIFSIQYDRAGVPSDVNTSGHGLQGQYMAYYGDYKQTGLKASKGGSDQNSKKSLYLFEKGDQRFEATFMTTFYNAEMIDKSTSKSGTQGYYAYYNCTPAELAKLPIALKYFPHYVTDAEVEKWIADHASQCFKPAASTYGIGNPFAARLGFDRVTIWTFGATPGSFKQTTEDGYSFYKRGTGYQGMCVKKFDDPETTQTEGSNGYRDIVLMHVSQMYLINAEANFMAGDAGAALSKINDVRGRAGLAPLASFGAYKFPYETTGVFGKKDLDLILDEYAREMYAEQTRYADLRRTKQLIRYNLEFNRNITSLEDMQGVTGEYKWYRPFPAAAIEMNEAVGNDAQNPGY